MHKTIKCAAPSAKVIFCLVVVFAAFTFSAISTSAGVNGAIYTTNFDGSVVNGNIYASKDLVYLSGGPQNKNATGLSPAPGFYYFQVTDPSGAVLLSTDNITCRVVYVNSDGRVDGIPGTGGSDSTAGGFGNSGCYHQNGTQNDFNGALPVQLIPYNDTPNPGGEYKAWMTPVGNYDLVNCASNFGFCDSDSKTDNFKVKNASSAYITVCKFNDANGDGIQEGTEPLISFWPINAIGVDTTTGPLGTVYAQTDATGCVSFSVSTFPNADNSDTVTLTENVLSGWMETAPLGGSYDINGNTAGSGPTSVSVFVETITVKAGDSVTAPNFGNTCTSDTCGGFTVQLVVTKDANPMLTRTFTWGITKSVDTTTVYSAGGGTSGAANYTVTVTHDAGTDSAWQATGTIKVSNPSLVDVTGVTVTDAVDNSGTCTITDTNAGVNEIVPASMELDLPYKCSYGSLPSPGTNTATAAWDSTSVTGTASVNFSGAAIKAVDNSVNVTDTLGGTLGTITINSDGSTTPPAAGTLGADGSTVTFKYPLTFTDAAGTCTDHTNTATFTTNTTKTTGSNTNTVTVTDCQGADLTVTKTATPSFSSSISKSVNKTTVDQSGGNITFNYTVTVTESSWAVGGNITVTNPNSWEAITVTLSDILSDAGGSCTINGGTTSVSIAASSSPSFPYSCTFASAPGATSGTNTGKVTWDATASHTPRASASSAAVGYTFATRTITDNVQSSANPSGCSATLGTVSVTTTTLNGTPGCGVTSLASSKWGVFTYTITDANSAPGTCTSYTNTATVVGPTVLTSPHASQTVTVCNTNTGALTMGFWKNTNGAKIITASCSGSGGTSGISLYTYLTGFNPFKDDTNTTCAKQATYVATVIGGATCSTGGTCNTMLRAQMLATALDVYFSNPNLGGNKIGAYNGLGGNTPVLGGVSIDLSKICAMTDGSSSSSCTGTNGDARLEFGICSGLNTPVTGCTVAAAGLGTTVSMLLSYANHLSTVNGSPVATTNTGASWYVQVKTKQVPAKDAFDNINNAIANITTSTASPSF